MATQRELINFYRKEFRRSRQWRSGTEDSIDDDWRRYVDLYAGRHYDRRTGTDQLTVNMVFSTVNTMEPSVSVNNPRFVVNARDPESQVQAILTEEVLNFLWRTHKFQREFRLSVRDFLIVGHGWMKVGYKAVKQPEVEEVENTDPADGEEAANEGIDDREDVEGSVESEMIQSDDRPFLERISVFDMFVDPDARHPKEMRWIAQRVWRPAADVKVDKRYSATARRKVQSSSWSRWTDSRDGDARVHSDAQRQDVPERDQQGFVEVIEFYDIKRQTVQTFALEGDEDSGFLIRPEPMPYADGHPFVMIRNHEVPDHFYPIGDVAQMESLQLELNETRNQILNYRKQYRRATAYSKDLVDRDGVQALQSGEDNVAIGVRGDDNPGNAFAAIPTTPIPADFFNTSAMIAQDIDRVSGVTDYQRGGQDQQINRTATEASMIADAASARAQDRLAKIEATMAELAERVIKLMQQYLTGEHVARIVTIPVDGWINYTRDNLVGNFDFEVMGGSTEPRNETFRRQSAIQLADIAIPFMDQGVVNVPALWQKLLQDGFGMRDAQRLVQMPPPPPEAQMPPEQAPPVPPGMEGGPPMQGPPPMGPEQMGGPMQLTPEMLAMMSQGGAPSMPSM